MEDVNGESECHLLQIMVTCQHALLWLHCPVFRDVDVTHRQQRQWRIDGRSQTDNLSHARVRVLVTSAVQQPSWTEARGSGKHSSYSGKRQLLGEIY